MSWGPLIGRLLLLKGYYGDDDGDDDGDYGDDDGDDDGDYGDEDEGGGFDQWLSNWSMDNVIFAMFVSNGNVYIMIYM